MKPEEERYRIPRRKLNLKLPRTRNFQFVNSIFAISEIDQPCAIYRSIYPNNNTINLCYTLYLIYKIFKIDTSELISLAIIYLINYPIIIQ